MTDTQILTVVIALIAAVGAILWNNSRISDIGKRIDEQRDSLGKRIDEQRDSLGERIDEQRDSLNKRFDDVNRHINDKFALVMERLDRMEDNLTNQLANHEARLYKLGHPSDSH